MITKIKIYEKNKFLGTIEQNQKFNTKDQSNYNKMLNGLSYDQIYELANNRSANMKKGDSVKTLKDDLVFQLL